LLRRDDIEAVIIAAPTPGHAELALAAARARKHLYVEKPLATGAADASEVQAAVRQAGIVAVMGFNRRFHPVHVRARRLLTAGRIGRIHFVQGVFCEPAPTGLPAWKGRRETGGGVLLDLASHHFDLVRWLLGDEAAQVRATTNSLATEQDSADVHLTLRSGVTMEGHFSFHGGPADALEFFGERGTLRVDRHAAAPELRVPRRLGYGVRRAWVPQGMGDIGRHAWHWLRPSRDPSFRAALAAFVEQVRGQNNDSATLADGAASLAIVLAAESAAGSGTVVEVAPIG
jgi:myo-inositol 2-dehydrogenase/D-chiro-inositol 1-dehydrogenase